MKTKREECMIVVAWTGLNDAGDDGRGHRHRRGEVTVDLGFGHVPQPPFTDGEMQTIASAAVFAARKIAAGRLSKRPAATTAKGPVRITPPQEHELRQLADRPQTTFGARRARVQNCLVDKGLAVYVDESGSEVPRFEPGLTTRSAPNSAIDSCTITKAGRAFLKSKRSR